MPTELLYVIAALVAGYFLYRYFSGHGGVRISQTALGSLPAEGEIVVRQHQVRWRSAEDGSFVAAWPLASGRLVAMKVTFDIDEEAVEEAADQGQLEISIDRRVMARNVTWTDQIKDRSLRADAEAVLKALAREAKGGVTERRRIRRARPVKPDELDPANDERQGPDATR